MEAAVFCINLASAAMPLLVPRRTERARCFDAFLRILRWCSYLGKSIKMWLLDPRVLLSHGHDVGSGDRGMKNWRNSPV